MKDPITDLSDRLAMLGIRHSVAFDTVASPPEPHVLYTVAEELIRPLRLGTANAADFSRIRAVIDPADTDRSDFWGSDLGRLLFRAGGFIPDECTQAVAAAVLGCSRQWVSAMVAEGKLTKVEGGVPVEQVRQVLENRANRLMIDKTVK